MKELVDSFTDHVNADPELKAYRDWIEANVFGFGERCFYWMWYRLVHKMPQEFNFLEVGVFRGQILGLVSILSRRLQKADVRVGVTPLDATEVGWESDYRRDIAQLHKIHAIDPDYTIIEGYSTDPKVQKMAARRKYDIVYIDGGHEYETVKADLEFYPNLVKPGGFLVIDDCNNQVDMPAGMFRGHESVSKAVDEIMPPFAKNPDWEFMFNIVHNRILKRI